MKYILGSLEIFAAFAIAFLVQKFWASDITRVTIGCLIAILLAVMVARGIRTMRGME